MITYKQDDDGNPIPSDINDIDWTQSNRVAKDTVNGLLVSTVFLRIDHSFGDGGPPVLWETMVFPKGDFGELYCERYTSRQAALLGHNRVVKHLAEGKPVDQL